MIDSILAEVRALRENGVDVNVNLSMTDILLLGAVLLIAIAGGSLISKKLF
jgi:hypothetical protein